MPDHPPAVVGPGQVAREGTAGATAVVHVCACEYSRAGALVNVSRQ